MLKKWNISYNPYFFFPFLVWIVFGGMAQLLFTKEQLFFAINARYTSFTDVLMYYITWLGEGRFIVIFLLLLFATPRLRSLWFFVTGTLCSVVPLIIQQFLKEYFKAPRPHSYFHGSSAMHFLPAWPSLVNNSFPSGHSEGAFSFFCLLSLIVPEKYIKAGWIFFLLAISVCYSRIYLTAHFFEDVYAGSIIGCMVTTIIFSIMTRYKTRLAIKKDPLS